MRQDAGKKKRNEAVTLKDLIYYNLISGPEREHFFRSSNLVPEKMLIQIN